AATVVGLAQLAVPVTDETDGASPDARVPTDPDAIADVARGALDDDTLARILAAVKPGLFGADEGTAAAGSEAPTDEPVLQGDLRVVPIAEVLQLLSNQAHSGVLTAQRARGTVEIFFRQGRVDFAAAQGVGEEFLLGRFIVALELMNKPDLEAVVADAGAPRGGRRTPLGQQLVKLGYVSEGELRQAL